MVMADLMMGDGGSDDGVDGGSDDGGDGDLMMGDAAL